MQKLIRYAKKVTVTVTIDSREDPYRSQGEHQLFSLSKKTISTLMSLAREVGADIEDALVIKPSNQSRFGRASALSALEQNLFRPHRRSFGEKQEQISLHLLRNPEEEVGWTALRICRLIREQGFHYRDFAVITGNMEAYGHCLERIFPEYGIPCFLDYKRSVLGNPFIEFLRSLLEMTEQDFTYETVFRFLRSGLSGMKREDTDLLENYVLALGIRGRKKWENRFIRTYGSLTEEELFRIDDLRQQFASMVLPFGEVMRKKGVDVFTRTAALYRLIEKLEIQKKLAAFEERFQKEGNQVLAKEYHQIYPIVMDLLDKLVDLLGDQKLSAREYREILGGSTRERLNTLIHDIVIHNIDRLKIPPRELCEERPMIRMSLEVGQAMQDLRTFMFKNLYTNPIAKGEETKAQELLEALFSHYMEHPDAMSEEFLDMLYKEQEEKEIVVCDYISGMTDQYAIYKFNEYFIPKAWSL